MFENELSVTKLDTYETILDELNVVSTVYQTIQKNLKMVDTNLQNLKSISSWLHKVQVNWELMTSPSWLLQIEFIDMKEMINDWQFLILMSPPSTSSSSSLVSLYYFLINSKLIVHLNPTQDLPSIMEIYLINSNDISGKEI